MSTLVQPLNNMDKKRKYNIYIKRDVLLFLYSPGSFIHCFLATILCLSRIFGDPSESHFIIWVPLPLAWALEDMPSYVLWIVQISGQHSTSFFPLDLAFSLIFILRYSFPLQGRRSEETEQNFKKLLFQPLSLLWHISLRPLLYTFRLLSTCLWVPQCYLRNYLMNHNQLVYPRLPS